MNGSGSWVEIHLDRLRANAAAIRRAVQPAELMAVIKSDAYGHGLPAVAKTLAQVGISQFAVAYVSEAQQVREAVPGARLILVLGVADPEEVPILLSQQITPVVVCREHAQKLSSAAQATGQPLRVHLKVDTGMGRLGFVCPAELPQAVEVCRMPGLLVEGICTHFAMVEPQKKPMAARNQVEKFRQALGVIEAVVGRRLFRHMSSSRAALLLPECDHDAVRVGIALYGYGAAEADGRFCTQPVLQWKSRVIQVKSVPAGFPVGYYSTYKTPAPTEVATVSCGYADGYQRHLGNKGQVLIGAKRRPVVGRVSMNWITVDVGPDSGVQTGDEVVLIGEQGGEKIWADELARHCNTIAYEILTGIGKHIPRRYGDSTRRAP